LLTISYISKDIKYDFQSNAHPKIFLSPQVQIENHAIIHAYKKENAITSGTSPGDKARM
jgi:hypothetical protein